LNSVPLVIVVVIMSKFLKGHYSVVPRLGYPVFTPAFEAIFYFL